ncbi:unnamed protein product [Diabrotica balteata]|uniref:Proton-coupled folate transporter n=1 Tax=Diabrotica balteata TaxID=107213 RepID=A0A9N9XAN5_DIABA|nr:unnamed protein product [Diabrotica balteata]
MAWYKKVTIEVPVVLCFFSMLLVSSITTNFIYYRTCYTILGNNETDCRNLGKVTEKGETSELEVKVQKAANIIVMVTELPPALIPVFINMLAGAWSDINGRKPVLLMVMGGQMLSFMVFGILIFFRNLTPWAFLSASIPSMFTGGFTTYFTITLAYLNDISTAETRGIRMATYESVMIIGTFLGTFCSSYLLYATSYETCYLLAAGLFSLGILYVIFLLPESLPLKIREVKGKTFQGAFNFRLITDNFKTAFKKRTNNNRIVLLLIIIIFTLIFFVVQGERAVKFPFVREKLQWTLQQNNTYSSISLALHMLIAIIGIYFLHHKLKIRGTILGLTGLISLALTSLLLGFTVSNAYMYAALLIGSCNGFTIPMLRTEIGHVIPADEMGKVFGVISALQGLITFGAASLYTLFYNATIGINTALYNFISFGVYTTAVFLVLIIIILKKRQSIQEIFNTNAPFPAEQE